MPRENPIGEYLRARRELVRPEDVELPQIGNRRRVHGLRREEVALLAGVSTDYYVRLEQGRDQHPSTQVLDALARALQLDDDATAHLHRLATPPVRRRRRSQRPDKVPASILRLIASWSETPAYVYGRYMDVLAANPLATAVAPYHAVGVNLVRAAFLDPRVRDMYGDWEQVTASTVAGLRAHVGPDVDDPGLNELVGELSVRSERFRQLWARHDARPKRSGTSLLDHPQVGPLELGYEKLPIPDSNGQTLVVYHADPGFLQRPSAHPAGHHCCRPARTCPEHGVVMCAGPGLAVSFSRRSLRRRRRSLGRPGWCRDIALDSWRLVSL